MARQADRHRDTERRRLYCNERYGGCGQTVVTEVHIDRQAGVAGFTCPECDTTHEPAPPDRFNVDWTDDLPDRG